MIVFKNKKIAILAIMMLAINIVATANNRLIGPGDGLKIDTIEGCGLDTINGVLQDFVRSFDKTFSVNKNTTVVLSNKYGSIDVHTGSGSKVIVKVKVTVVSNTQAQADKVFERVNIAFVDGPDFVKTETTVENQPRYNSIFPGNNAPCCDFRIDYDVTMPVGNRLDLTNRHGNSTIAALKTSVKIDQKYGDFRLDGATSATVILAYGGGQLSELNTLYGNISYGKLTSPHIKNGYIKSIYSQFRFDQIDAMEIQSNYDVYDINDANSLKSVCKYSTMNVRTVENLTTTGNNTGYKVQKIENNADFNCQNGTIRIGSVKNNFGTINIKGNNTNCVMVIDPSVSYQLDMNGTYSTMNQPASLRPLVDKKVASRREVMGTVGNNPHTKSTVRVAMTYGEFRIK